MKIILLTDEFYPKVGGMANLLTNLYKFIKTKGHILYVINPYFEDDSIYKELLLRKSYRINHYSYYFRNRKFLQFLLHSFLIVLKQKKIPYSYRVLMVLYFFTKPKETIKIVENISHLFYYLKNLDFDVILLGSSGWLLQAGFILSRIFNKKCVTIAHGLDFIVVNPLTLRTFYFRSIDKIIVTNQQMKKLIKKTHHLREDKINVVNIGLDPKMLEVKEKKEKLRKKYNIPEDQFVILSIGRHVRRKNFRLVIRAIKEIKCLRNDLDIKYFLIGNGPETEFLKSLTKKLNLERVVTFFGFCDIKKRNEFYKLSDLFVMPSLTQKNDIEGFGIVFLEANYFGLPVIGSATGGIIEAIDHKRSGFLVKEDNLEELVDKILILYENKELRNSMGEYGKKRIQRKFLWDEIANIYIKILKKTISD